MRKLLIVAAVLLSVFHTEAAQKPKFDYSLVVVPEEVVQQISNSNENDLDGVLSRDDKTIFSTVAKACPVIVFEVMTAKQTSSPTTRVE